MESLVLVLLAALVVLLVVFFAGAFLNAAFASPRALAAAGDAGRRLPLLSGGALRRWAEDKAREVVAKHARRPRTAEMPIALAHEIEGLASRVIDESLQRGPRGRSAQCASSGRDAIAASAPEVLAIADDLRRHVSRRELAAIRSRAERNADRSAAEDALRGEAGSPGCPLLSQHGCCLTNESRPIYCRGRCPECRGEGGACGADQERPDAAFAVEVGQGVSDGLRQGLAAAGWDGQLYELNTALVRALDLPDATDRWARGEPVFESCRQLEFRRAAG
ncbi:MAG: hypothetical protein HYS13_06045 [Planctomycetia bacterium]|nr:hypothetical protein [Planctomycetia bacterium]